MERRKRGHGMSRRIDICPTCKGKGEIIVDNWLTEGMIEEELAKKKKEALADIVEVVRCKDCKHNVANWQHDELDIEDYTDIVCDYFMTDGMEANDYCSHGERRDDNEG
jgi:hypothetical protein